MALYFFNIYHGHPDLDAVGEELPDRNAVWSEATVTAGQMLQALAGKLQPGVDWRMEVTDEFSKPLYAIHVSAKHFG
jgi:hypothetical protein